MTKLNNELTQNPVENEVVTFAGEEVAAQDVSAFNPAIFEQPQQAVYSSIQGDDRATRIKVFNAVNASDNALGDHLGEPISITDMVAHPIELTDEITGKPVQAMRVVLLDAEGNGYHSVSQGVVSSLQKIMGIVGQAPWTPALEVIPVEVKTRKGFKTLTLRLKA